MLARKTRRLFGLVSALHIAGCCAYKYADEDFLLTDFELSHFSSFTSGDTLFYESSNGDIDTFKILEVSPTNEDPGSACGSHFGVNRNPANGKYITIQHLPIDKWHGTSKEIFQDGTTKETINYQHLFTITKFPLEKEVQYSISYKDFYAIRDSVIGEFYKDTIFLNNRKWTNYFKVAHSYPERVTDSTDIEIIYWTTKEGLIAYQNKAGEIWTRKK